VSLLSICFGKNALARVFKIALKFFGETWHWCDLPERIQIADRPANYMPQLYIGPRAELGKQSGIPSDLKECFLNHIARAEISRSDYRRPEDTKTLPYRLRAIDVHPRALPPASVNQL
jgi:predicted Zn-dependent protease